MSTTPPPTRQEALQAFDLTCRRVYAVRVRTRPHWPATYEAAMADPLIGRLIELDAREGISLGARASQQQAKPAKRFIDGKSRASGERDED